MARFNSNVWIGYRPIHRPLTSQNTSASVLRTDLMPEYDPSQFSPQVSWNAQTHQWQDANRKTRTTNNREKIKKAIDAAKGHGYSLQDIKLPAYPQAQGAGPEKFASAEDHARTQAIAEMMQAIRQTSGGEPPEITALRMKRLNDGIRSGEIPIKTAVDIARLEQQIRMEGKRSAGKYEEQMRNLDQASTTAEKWKMNPQVVDQTREQTLAAMEAAQPAVDALFNETAKNMSRVIGKTITAAELRSIVKGLSHEQLAAATSQMQAVIMPAGAGAGKSMVLQTMAMQQISQAKTPQEALESAKSITVLSQTHSAVDNFMKKLSKIREIVPGWTQEQFDSQGKTLASWAMSQLTKGQTMGSADNPVSILQTIAQKTGMIGLAPLYQGGKGDTIEAELEKKKQADILRRVFERHQIKGQGSNLAHFTQRIEEIKGQGRETLAKSMKIGGQLYAAGAHKQGSTIPDDLALYLYQQALRNKKGFDLPELGGPRFDINDAPHMLLYAANAGMMRPKGTYIVDESQDTPPVYGELFAAMGKINPATRYFSGGDLSQMAIDRPWHFDKTMQRAFGPDRSSYHPLTINFRSDDYTVGFLNAINGLAIMADQPKSPMQISYAGPGRAPETRVEQDQTTLHRAMVGDWMEHMQTSLPQLKEGMEMSDPFGATRFLPGEAPFQFTMGKQRESFLATLSEMLGEVMPPEMVKEFMTEHVTSETPSGENIMKIHALMMSQARGREFPAVFSDLTYGGLWNQIGLNKQMFTMASRVTAGGQNFHYGSLTNIGQRQHDLTPDYFAGQKVMGGFGTLLQGMTEDMVKRQGSDPSQLAPSFRMAYESNPRIMYPEGKQEATQRRGPAANPELIQEYIDQVSMLREYHSPAVGMGASGIQQGDPLQYSRDDPQARGHMRTRGTMNAATVAGQTRRGGQNQMLIEQASRIAESLLRQGPGKESRGKSGAITTGIASVPTPQEFMTQAKSATKMIPHHLLEEVQRESPSEFTEFDNRPDNFIKRDWHEGYQGKDDKRLRSWVRTALSFPGIAQSPEIMQRAAAYYTHPQVKKVIAGLAHKNAKNSSLANLQEKVRLAWMPEGLIHRKKQRIDELTFFQERAGKLPKALQGLNIGKGADVSQKKAEVGRELTKEEKVELARLQEEIKHVGPEAQNRIISAITTKHPVDPKHDPKLFNQGLMQTIHRVAIGLLAESRLDPEFLEELARRAYQVHDTLKNPKQKEMMQSIARQFLKEAQQMRDDGAPLTERMLAQIRQKDPAQAALLSRLFRDKETGELLPYNHPDVMKNVSQIDYHRGVVERGQGAAIGMPIPYSRTAPARTQLRTLYRALQGGLWEGHGMGVLDRHAQKAIARPGADPEKARDDDYDFHEYGIGAPLDSQIQRYTEMLRRGGLKRPQQAEIARQLRMARQVKAGFGSEENQRDWAHTLQIASKASTGENVIDLRKGEEFDRDPIRGWFEHRENTVNDHRSLESLIGLMQALQQATQHIQKTGTLKRSHLDQLLGAFGYSPDDKRMTGLRKLEEKAKFKGEADLPLQNLIGQFPEDAKNMQEQLTRGPLVPEHPYTFRGGEEGFGGLTIAQQKRGIPVGAEIEGTLHPFAEGEPFGVSKYGSIHLREGMFTEQGLDTLNMLPEAEKNNQLRGASMPLFQFQGTHQGNPISFPVNPEQLLLVSAEDQAREAAFSQGREEAHWQNVRQKNREENAYSPEEIMRLSNPRPRYALDPSPDLGQHGFYSYSQMRAIEPEPGNPQWITQGQIDAGGGYDWNAALSSPLAQVPTLHGESWGTQQLVGLLPQPTQEIPSTDHWNIPEHGPGMQLDTDFLDQLMKDAPTLERGAEQSLLSARMHQLYKNYQAGQSIGGGASWQKHLEDEHDFNTRHPWSHGGEDLQLTSNLLGVPMPSSVGETSTHPLEVPAIQGPKRTQPLPMVDAETHLDPQDPKFQTQPMQTIEPLPPHADPTHPDFQTWSMKAVNFDQTNPDMAAIHPSSIPAIDPLQRKGTVRGKSTTPSSHPQELPVVRPTRATSFSIPKRPQATTLQLPERTIPPVSRFSLSPQPIRGMQHAFLTQEGMRLLPRHAASRVEAVRNMRPRFYRTPRSRRQFNRGRAVAGDVVPLGPEHHPPLQIGGPRSPLLLPQNTSHWRRAAAQARINAARQGIPSSSSAIPMEGHKFTLGEVPGLLREGGRRVAGVNLPHLSKEQLDILNSQEKHLAIQGGPGTGKTDIAVMRQLDQIAQGKLQAPGIRAFSGLHSGADEINERYEKLLRPMLPSGPAYQVPPAGTVHSFAHQIAFPHGKPSPLLQGLGWGHMQRIIANPSPEELATMTPEEASIKKDEQSGVLRSAMKSFYPAGTKGIPHTSADLEAALKDINTWKQSRFGEGSLYDKNMEMGRTHLQEGIISHQGAFAAYEQALPQQQVGDYSDLISATRQMLQTHGSEAIPPQLANTQQIFYDEQQDAPPEQMAMLHAFRRATGAEMMVGLDPMQALFQENAEKNIPALKEELGGEGFAHHELTVNYRGDKSNVAVYNAVLGQSANPLSRPQVAASPIQGQRPQFILSKSEPELYKRTFASMLGDTGVDPSHIAGNIAAGRHPFHGVDWSQQGLTKPGQIPIQFTTKAQRRLFEHVAPKAIEGLDSEHITPEMAKQAFHQMYRSGVPGKKAYDADKKSFAQGTKFGGIMVGQARSRAYDKPVAVVHRAGYWAKDTPEARESYLNNLGVQVSRVRAGGRQTLVAASRPFSSNQTDEYIRTNGAKFEDTHPDSLSEGTVRVGPNKRDIILGNPNTTHFEQWQGQYVPHDFPQIMSAATSQISDWQAQLSSPALPSPSAAPIEEEPQHPLAMPAVSGLQSSLHVFEGNVPPSRMARGMYPQGHPYQPWAVARRIENQQRLAYSPVGRLYPRGGQVPPPLSREESLLALPSPRSQPSSDAWDKVQGDVVRGNTPRPTSTPSQAPPVVHQGEALPAGVGFQKINIPPGGNINIQGTDIKIEAKSNTSSFSGAGSSTTSGPGGGFRFAGSGGALGPHIASGLGGGPSTSSGGGEDIIIRRRGGGGAPPSGPPSGSDKDYATPFFGGMQQTGRTLARISSETQYIGQLFSDITTKAAQQGSEYRRATTGMAGAGATADQGFFDFSNSQSGISQMSANLPMYSNVQNAQMLRNVAAQTGGFGINTGTATTYQQLGAVTGMDPTQLMQQGAYFTGTTGQGMSTKGTNNLVASMEGLYGGNLTATNVAPTMQAINSVMPSMQGNALGQGNQLKSLMTIFGGAMAGGANAQNLPDIAGTIGNLTQIGMNPDLRQQYTMSKMFPGQLTADTQLTQFNQQQLGQSEQIDQLSLQKAVNLPGLQIKINNADIAMQSANFDLAKMQQSYNEASYQNAQLNQQYSEANFQEQQYVQTQEYGPIGADTGRNSYFDFMRNQQNAGYNPLSAEAGTQFKPSAPQGIQNMQFYAGVEHQRQDMILSRSPLLSDAKFQEDMKYLNQQEAFYKEQLNLTNQQRKFEVDWTTKLLASQGHLLDMQGPMLDQQKKILGIQGQQLDLNKAMTDYQNKSLTIQGEYLPKQLDALLAIQKATGEFMNGQGPLNGENVTPEMWIKQLAGVKDDKEMRQKVQGLGLSPTDTNNMIRIVEGVKKTPGGWDALQKSTAPNDKALQKNIDDLKKSGAFTDQKSQAAINDASLNLGGTGGSWTDFTNAFDTANDQWKSIATSLSSLAPAMKDIATFMSISGPVVMGAALILNTVGTAGNIASTANKVVPGGAASVAVNPVTGVLAGLAVDAWMESLLPDVKPGGGIGGGKGQNSIWNILGHSALTATPGGAGIEAWKGLSGSGPGVWNGITGAASWFGGLFNGGPNQTRGGTATQGGAGARGGSGLNLPHGAIDHAVGPQKGGPKADLGPALIKGLQAGWDAFWKTDAGKGISGFFTGLGKNFSSLLDTIFTFFTKTLPKKFGEFIDGLKSNLGGFWQWLKLEAGSAWDKISKWFMDNIGNPFMTWATVTVPKFFENAINTISNWFNPSSKHNIGQMLADSLSKVDWGKAFGHIFGGGAGGSGGGSEPAGHPGFSTPNVNTDFGAKVWYGTGKHQGVDFKAAQGTQLREFVGGEVTKTGFYDWGGEVDVKIPGGLTERYLHLSSIGVKRGDIVGRGKYIGLTGGGTKQSGLGYWSTGAHSHVQYDTGGYDQGVNPWSVWRKFADMNLANYYGPVGKPEGAAGGDRETHGGGAGIPIPHLATGGIAMTPMMASIAEREPEMVVPLSKLSETLKSLHQSGQGTVVTQSTTTQQKQSVEVKNLIGNATFNISTGGSKMSDHEKDELMSQIFEVFAEAIKQLNGKL